MKLILENITKTYSNGVKALDDISITIKVGMFGLLGPNGAGKSSLMRTIATLQEPDSGSLFLDEINIVKQKFELRKILGYLPQDFGVYPKISAEVLLDHFAALKGISNKTERKDIVTSVLQLTNIYEHRKKNLGGYSGGMLQRFGIAQALLANPKLIIVDEPTAGLDPSERQRFLNLLREIGGNSIVILSTHIVDDVNELCNKVAILNRGKILLTDSPANAIKSLNGKIWHKAIDKEELDNYKQQFNVISSRFEENNLLGIHVLNDSLPNESFTSINPNLEDVYFCALSTNET
ncbi:MAG TPA: ABC transporter ATP-binding protein [Flavobacteriales bacterium]|nr:ABC transporter ATP-binding protein [Flavobacteriales bacterium]